MKNQKTYQIDLENLFEYFRHHHSLTSSERFIFFDNSKAIPNFPDYSVFNGLLLAFCLQGQQNIIIKGQEYVVKAPALITILPNNVFKTNTISDDFHSKTLFLSQNFTTSVTSPYSFKTLMLMEQNPWIKLSPQNLEDLLILRSLLIKYDKRTEMPFHFLMIKSILFSLLVEVGNIYLSNFESGSLGSKSREMVIAEQFFLLLTECNPTKRGISYYADKLCLSSKYLSSVVKKMTGYSIPKWINSNLISEAKNYLKTTDLTILEISERLKFPSPSFFVQFFKQNTGVTPLKYRRDVSDYTIL